MFTLFFFYKDILKKNLSIDLFLAVWVFSAVHWLLMEVASLVVERGLQGMLASVVAVQGLSSCSAGA